MATPTKLDYKSLYAGQLPSSKGTLYTVPAATETMVHSIIVFNTGGGSNTVTLYIKRSGGTSRVIDTTPLATLESILLSEVGPLSTGDIIEGFATNATQVDITILGGEAT